MGIKILQTSSYLPDDVVTNIDFEDYLDTSNEWIISRTGIKERRFSATEDTSDLVYKVLENLKKIDSSKVDLVMVATFTPDKIMPTISSTVQKKLNLREDIFTLDFNMACSGFVAGLKLCDKYLDTGRQGILIGAEVISKTLDKNDRGTVILFGDGAGAVVLEKTKNNQYFEVGTRSNDKCLKLDGKTFKFEESFIEMQGKEVFRFATETLPTVVDNLLNERKLKTEDIDYVVCHQANYRIIRHISKKTNIPIEKIYMNLDKYGNTSAASVPIVLDEMNRGNLLKKGQKIIILGFGAGLNWCGTILEW